MKWGNAIICNIDLDKLYIEAELILNDKNFKNTKKLNWLAKTESLITIKLVEYDHLVTVKNPTE